MDRSRRLLPAVWLGMLLCIALIAAPAPFATLAVADAGRVVSRIFVQEAWLGLALPLLVVMLERRRRPGLSAELLLAFGALFCTVGGYFAVLPMMEAARAGQGRLGLGTLHAVSMGFFGVKMLLVATLAWRVNAPARAS